jgi:hypothetical protein
MAELPRGKDSFEDTELDQDIEFPGGVHWDGKYVAVGNQYRSVIYHFTVKGTADKTIGATQLSDSNDVVQFWIQGGNLIGPDWIVAGPQPRKLGQVESAGSWKRRKRQNVVRAAPYPEVSEVSVIGAPRALRH